MFEIRAYEDAKRDLERFSALLGDERQTFLDKIAIEIKRGEPAVRSGEADCVAAFAALIRADLQRYAARVIHDAQDKVKAAGDALRSAVAADLKSNLMRD
jgi:hypothetical protein